MSAPEKGEDIIFNAAMITTAGMVLSVIFAMFDAGAWCLVFLFGATAYSIIYAFKGFQKIQEREKKWERERPERARERERAMAERAMAREKHLDYEGAIEIYEENNMPEEAARVRKLKAEQGAVKVDQTVVHGDYVDDRDTIIQDSVVSKSSIGGGSSKMQELKDLTEMKEKGLIDGNEFKQMKKEILGK